MTVTINTITPFEVGRVYRYVGQATSRWCGDVTYGDKLICSSIGYEGEIGDHYGIFLNASGENALFWQDEIDAPMLEAIE